MIKDEVERFLFDEAELLDRWKLTEWEALLTDDARYLVPPIGLKDADEMTSDTTLFFVADDRAMLAARVHRMEGRAGFAELPRSNVRHMIANIRILAEDGDEVQVAANFTVYRIRRAQITTYIGQYRYKLVRAGTSFRIREKKALLDIDVLRGQGGLSFIL